MSTYIDLYIRPKLADTNCFYVLDSWSRSSETFQLLEEFVQYGHTVQLTNEIVTAALALAHNKLDNYEQQVSDYRDEINFLASFTITSDSMLNTILEKRHDYLDFISQASQNINELKDAIHLLEILSSFLDTASYLSDGVDYFLSYEDNPNSSDSEK